MARAFGNVAMLSTVARDELEEWGGGFERIVEHEKRHREQFRALGMWIYAAEHILPIEPMNVHWNDPSVELAEMWKPPTWWRNQWAFVSITMRGNQ